MGFQPPTDYFQVQPIPAAWGNATPISETKPSFWNDEGKKKAFGIALAKQNDQSRDSVFSAALEVFEQVGPSLWVTNNWLSDPVVIASRDIYRQSMKAVEKPLDKVELAARLLALAEEKVERDGRRHYIYEAKDRIAAYKAYGEILGYIGKVNIDNSTNTFNNNQMEIVLVKADVKEEKVIENKEENVVEMLDIVPLEIKLVS